MAKVSFKIVSKDNFSANKDEGNPEYVPGQIIFVEGLDKIYLDFHNERRCYSSGSSLNYVGVTKDNPLVISNPTSENYDPTGKVKLEPNKEIWQPSANDMVVYNTKEYLWRKNEDGTYAWFEVGDEEAPTWNE